MVASRLYACILSACFLLLLGPSLLADTLEITSTPSGATVEINGVARGRTPYREDLPGGYFHRPLTTFGKRLEYPMTARIMLEGYVTRELQLTEGPKEWVSLKGRNHGQYWLLSNKRFHVELERLSDVFTGALDREEEPLDETVVSMHSDADSDMKTAIMLARPAVVQLKGLKKAGSGFFVKSEGIIVTNAHVTRGEGTLQAILFDGRKLPARVIDPEEHLDLALLKVDGDNFPRLAIAGRLPQIGDNVITIGNPAGAMSTSVTKGVVSAVGKFSTAGPGTWIQTDAIINPGNSGGPLLNSRGEVVGITSERLATRNGGGLTFALSSPDLLKVLSRFYPSAPPAGEMAAQDSGFAIVRFTKPEGAQVRLDHRHIADAPASIHVTPGTHMVSMYYRGKLIFATPIEVRAGDDIHLGPD